MSDLRQRAQMKITTDQAKEFREHGEWETVLAHDQPYSRWEDRYAAAFAASEVQAAVERERAECKKAMCSYCRDGDVPEQRMYSHPPKPFWVHTMIGFDDRSEDCAAAAIWQRGKDGK